MAKTLAHAEIEAGATEWKDRRFTRDGSIFTDRNLWTPETVAQPDQYYGQNLDEGEGKFCDKLKEQLANATPAAKCVIRPLIPDPSRPAIASRRN